VAVILTITVLVIACPHALGLAIPLVVSIATERAARGRVLIKDRLALQQNLWWAAGYNLIAVPLAAGVLAPIGFVMPMSAGAILMSISTVVVALNARVLRRLDLRPEASVKAIL
jgi:cation transport ATPase